MVAASLVAVACGALAGPALGAPAIPDRHYTVTIQTPTENPLVNQAFVISGSVAPAAPGTKLKLELKLHKHWRTAAIAKLDTRSHYQFAQVQAAVGSYPYRVTMTGKHTSGTSPTAVVWVAGSVLPPRTVMTAGDTLLSNGGSYQFDVLSNGNLVIQVASTLRTIWSFGTGGHPGAWVVLKPNGNLVEHTADGKVLKSTHTGGHKPGGFKLTMREYSNLAITGPDGHAWWLSNTINPELASGETLQPQQYLTSANKQYKMMMQAAGDLVIQDLSSGDTIWDTGTTVDDSRLIMRTDGDLVVLGPGGALQWASNTTGHPGAIATLQSDGDLVITDDGHEIWASDGIGGVIGDDYPPSLRDVPKDSVIDPWRFYNRECVSFVAWRMNHTNGVDFTDFMDGGRWGSAGHWDDNARALGFPVNNTPARGAIAQSDAEGHVAWVAAVGKGTVTIEEYNYAAPGVYGVRTVPTSTFVYIHVKDL